MRPEDSSRLCLAWMGRLCWVVAVLFVLTLAIDMQ